MRLTVSLLVASLAGATLTSCSSQQRVKTETALAKALISDEQEVQLGLQVRDELGRQNVKYVEDATVNQYVNAVSQKLFRAAEKDRPGVKWEVKVIDDPQTVNAFATPGGFLYVYTGLILTAANEAEFAGVMAHESGHVVGRHSARQMVNAYGLQSVASLALGQNPGMLQQVGTGLLAKGVLLAHSRSEEQEADEYGARYTSAAGYDPHGIATFFGKLLSSEGKQPGFAKFLSSHPPTQDRIAHINRYIEINNLKGSDLGADRIAPIKARLQQGKGTGTK